MALPLIISGQLTTAGTICSLPTATLNPTTIAFWTIELDGESIATAALVVAVQVQNLAKPGFFAPTVPAWNAISVATGSKQMLNWTGPLAGIQINVASFGTSTGTFYGQIIGIPFT